MKKVIVSYGKMRDADELSFAKGIIPKMKDNANFPNLTPTVTEFTDTVDSYDTALVDSDSGDKEAIVRKNTLKKLVTGGLRQWAMTVNTVSQGNDDKLASSGFKPTKTSDPVHLAAPVIKSISQGLNPGELLVKITKPKGTKSLIYQVAKDPITDTTEWASFGDTRSMFLFTGLEEGAKYWFRVIAIGSNNQAVQSAEVPQYVLIRTMSATKAA